MSTVGVRTERGLCPPRHFCVGRKESEPHITFEHWGVRPGGKGYSPFQVGTVPSERSDHVMGFSLTTLSPGLGFTHPARCAWTASPPIERGTASTHQPQHMHPCEYPCQRNRKDMRDGCLHVLSVVLNHDGFIHTCGSELFSVDVL